MDDKIINKKAQSAMEYLMTYGWAILIIAVVLGALFSLGVFSGNNILGTACIAASGYLCQNPVYLHTNGQIKLTVGQNTGSSWTTANFVFVPQGASKTAGVPTDIFYANAPVNENMTLSPTSLTSGQSLSITLPVNGISNNAFTLTNGAGSLSVGSSAGGAIWVQYQTGGTGASYPFQYAQVASLNVKAS